MTAISKSIETPQIVTTTERHYAGLHLTVPREEIREVMGPGIREVYAELERQGIAAAGPWFTHHFKNPDTHFDYEICVPVAEAIQSGGRVEPRVWPSMRVAQTIYVGDYAGLATAWGEFEEWIASQGLRGAKDLWEVYLVNPDTGKEPADWRTELNRPLLG